jgi:hypothetical protein
MRISEGLSFGNSYFILEDIPKEGLIVVLCKNEYICLPGEKQVQQSNFPTRSASQCRGSEKQ